MTGATAIITKAGAISQTEHRLSGQERAMSLHKTTQVTGQLWGNSFMTHDQTLALTFDNRTKTTDCNNNTVRIAQQGVAFAILERTDLIKYD